MCIDGVSTMALVDTGATVSLMSVLFKSLLGRKVMFRWDQSTSFRGVGGDSLYPVGVCNVDVSLGGRIFNTEFIVLARPPHNVILGIDFLQLCGANLDCRKGELSVGESALSEILEDSPKQESVFCVSEDTVVPALSAMGVSVVCSTRNPFDAAVDPVHANCLKKNVLVPHCMVSVLNGRPRLWVINCSTEAAVLPQGLKLATFQENSPIPMAVLTELPDTAEARNMHPVNSKFVSMVAKSLSDHKRDVLVALLVKHFSVFDFTQHDGPTSVPVSRTCHRINTGSAQPIRQKPYRVSPAEREIISEQVEMLTKGVIQESSSPWAAPVILVKKKDGTWRFCVDYRRLNNVTKKDVYPLPRIDDAIDCLYAASYFSSVDLRSGYWQIPMHIEDKEKNAFVMPDGLFEFKVMPFGLCNTPAMFERFMDTILRGLKWEVCMCYLDDVVIFGRTFSEHNKWLELVLNCLEKAGLVLNSKKCHFGERQAIVLGHQVDKEGIRPDPQKTGCRGI